jgi:endonuclease/exonuclease/phosphatase (EEP) superfamily protein YafD
MLVRIDVGGGIRPWIVAVHPPSPVFAANLPTRDRILADLATTITTLDGPVIVAGDFNATPYTPAFRDFVHAAGVATFRRLPATFPNRLGDAGLPIDHVMVRDAGLARLQALPSIGSDHRALAATILLPPG